MDFGKQADRNKRVYMLKIALELFPHLVMLAATNTVGSDST